MRGRYRSLVSLVFFSGTSVYSLDSTCDPRSLLTPSIRILLPLAYFLAKELARNATAMCVIHVWHTCQWCFVIPVLDVRQACHQLIKHLCCMVTKVMYCNICMAIINSTLLKDENRYSTESCILMNVWKIYTDGIIHVHAACTAWFPLIAIMNNAGKGSENHI